MQSILSLLADRTHDALTRAFGDAAAGADALITSSQNPKFGDYQSNCAMGLAKKVGKNPRETAAQVIAALDVADICNEPQIAGPGFINFTLKSEFVSKALESIPPVETGDGYDRLGIATDPSPETVVVDMSSPNLAKEMHVGHLRSTVIGEAVARLLEFRGHRVERINHVGDWGTQFGMLVAHLRSVKPDVLDDPEHLAIGNLESFYIEAKRHFDDDPAFADEARRTVVALQGGDAATLRIWRAFCNESLRHCHDVYERLGVRNLVDQGESYYNDRLAEVVELLERGGYLEKSEGADCVFLDDFVSKDGTPQPLMVRKSDGGYNYSATDLAAARYRINETGATRIIYVVGAPQKRHFDMLFAALRKTGWAGENIRLEHLAFGSMLSADGRPFKTREGGTVKLANLLDEAATRARAVVEANRGDDDAGLSEEQRAHIATTVGMSAVKYFDLSHNLMTDYKFDFDHMLSLEGNTAPYMLYAYARIRSIGRKAGIDFADVQSAPVLLDHESELALGRAILRYAETIDQAATDLRPNVLTEYLFELSKAFSRFYDRKLGVRVIDAESDRLRASRLRLCDLASRVLASGLNLLGIPTLEAM